MNIVWRFQLNLLPKSKLSNAISMDFGFICIILESVFILKNMVYASLSAQTPKWGELVAFTIM